MTAYVAGFMFDADDHNRVALILKNHPAWAAGMFNAIGGKIENLESSLHAMAREFEEETGYRTHPTDWRRFCVLQGNIDGHEFTVDFYRTYGDVSKLRTVTDEYVNVLHIQSVTVHNAMPNLQWLLPMARYFHLDRASEFVVTEQYAPALKVFVERDAALRRMSPGTEI